MAIFYDDDDFETDDLDNEAIYNVKIKVFGVGGGGCNALEHMAKQGVNAVEYVAVNTDVPALRSKDKNLMRRLQIGRKTTRGRGAGGDPTVAAESANEDRDEIIKALDGTSMVFISAGMGGGTGTGAAPVIAEIAQEMGILTVGVVTKPFDFEREQKMNQALKGIAEMRKYVDALVIIPNQRLIVNQRSLNVRQAFAMVDDVLYNVVRSISELLNNTAIINIDFADLRATLEKAGDAHIAIGTGTGENKVDEAIQQIVNSPLLETSIANAGKVLVNVMMSPDLVIQDVAEIMDKITGVSHPQVEVIYGADYDNELKDGVIVTLIATCFEDDDVVGDVKINREGFFEADETDFLGQQPLDQFITQNISTSYDDDPFRDLDEIFRKR